VDTALNIVHLLAAIVWVGGTVALVFVAALLVQRLEGGARPPAR
jgi:putative copper export protein